MNISEDEYRFREIVAREMAAELVPKLKEAGFMEGYTQEEAAILNVRLACQVAAKFDMPLEELWQREAKYLGRSFVEHVSVSILGKPHFKTVPRINGQKAPTRRKKKNQ